MHDGGEVEACWESENLNQELKISSWGFPADTNPLGDLRVANVLSVVSSPACLQNRRVNNYFLSDKIVATVPFSALGFHHSAITEIKI